MGATGLTALDYAINDHKLELAETLLQGGAKWTKNINILTTSHTFLRLKALVQLWENLLSAAKTNHTKQAIDYIAKLSDMSAEVNAKDTEGKTALHLAAKNNNIYLVNALINAGADVTINDNYSKKAILYAKSRGSAETALTAADNDWNTTDASARAAKTIRDAQANQPSPLEVAVAAANTDEVTSLINNDKAILTIVHANGGTILHYLINKNKGGAVTDANANEMLNVILQNMDVTSVDIRDDYLKSALHLAVVTPNTVMVHALINKNANLNLQDSYNNTALHLAVGAREVNSIKALISASADKTILNIDRLTPLQYAETLNFNDGVNELNSVAVDGK